MSTETEIAEVKDEKNASPEVTPKENEYKIFDYFKDHTGLLVTSISALVAVMSVILHFAVSRMNYAYLEYWDIASLHANVNNQNELYTVACSMMYILSLIIIHCFLSKTSDVYRYYNRLLSTVNQAIKISKKTNKQTQKELDQLATSFDRLPPKQKKKDAAKEIKKKIEKYKEYMNNREEELKEVKAARVKLMWWVIIQLFVAFFLSFVIGSLFLVLVNMTVPFGESLRSTKRIIFIIVADLIMYFVPAYFSTRCTSKQFTNEDILKRTTEWLDGDIPKFPFENFLQNGFKSIFSDKMLKLAAIQLTAVTFIILITMTITGTMSAKHQRSFPIYVDGTQTYAVVYTSGSTRFMEEAVIQDGVLEVDTTKQRIITSDDISYTIGVFEEVSVIKIDDELKIAKNTDSNNAFKKIGSFIKTMWSKMGEVMTKDAECVPGT